MSDTGVGPHLVLVRVAAPLGLSDVVVGTLEPVPSWEARHEVRRLVGTMDHLHNVSIGQANVRLEVRS